MLHYHERLTTIASVFFHISCLCGASFCNKWLHIYHCATILLSCLELLNQLKAQAGKSFFVMSEKYESDVDKSVKYHFFSNFDWLLIQCGYFLESILISNKNADITSMIRLQRGSKGLVEETLVVSSQAIYKLARSNSAGRSLRFGWRCWIRLVIVKYTQIVTDRTR